MAAILTTLCLCFIFHATLYQPTYDGMCVQYILDTEKANNNTDVFVRVIDENDLVSSPAFLLLFMALATIVFKSHFRDEL